MTISLSPQPSSKASGVILLGLSALSILFVSHHPTLGTPGFETLAEEAVAESPLNGAVHGGLIVIAIGFYLALSVFSDRLGRDYIAVRAGKTSFAIATIAMCGAALVSGFIVPDVARSLLRAGLAPEFEIQLRALGAINQVLAKTGTVAYGAALVFWSARLLRFSVLGKLSGAAGLLAGALLAGGILSDILALDVHGMSLVLMVMSLWFVLVAIMLLRE